MASWKCDVFGQENLSSLAATLDSEECAAHIVAFIAISKQVPSNAMEATEQN